MQEGQLAILWLLISTLALFLMIFGLRYIINKENMAMIDKGINPREYSNRPAPFRLLKWALLLVGAGIGLFLAYLIDNFMLRNTNDIHNEPVYFSLIAIGAGLGLLASYRAERKWWDDHVVKK